LLIVTLRIRGLTRVFWYFLAGGL